MHPGKIIADHFILTIPGSLPHALSVYVVRYERPSAAGFSVSVGGCGNFERTTEACELRPNSAGAPLPPVPKITHSQVISKGWAQRACQSEHQKFRSLHSRRC